MSVGTSQLTNHMIKREKVDPAKMPLEHRLLSLSRHCNLNEIQSVQQQAYKHKQASSPVHTTDNNTTNVKRIVGEGSTFSG